MRASDIADGARNRDAGTTASLEREPAPEDIGRFAEAFDRCNRRKNRVDAPGNKLWMHRVELPRRHHRAGAVETESTRVQSRRIDGRRL